MWNRLNITTMPVIDDQITMPKSRIQPMKRACSIAICARQISNAPFSFGSQTQNRPHESFAHTPPRIVPTTLNTRLKAVTPQIMRTTLLAIGSLGWARRNTRISTQPFANTAASKPDA